MKDVNILINDSNELTRVLNKLGEYNIKTEDGGAPALLYYENKNYENLPILVMCVDDVLSTTKQVIGYTYISVSEFLKEKKRGLKMVIGYNIDFLIVKIIKILIEFGDIMA